MRVKNIGDVTAFFHDSNRGGIRVRKGDVINIPDAALTKRRELFPGEKKLLDGNERLQATYSRIKDKDGKIPQCFSLRWMEIVDEPEKFTTAQQRVNADNEAVREQKQKDAMDAKAGAGGVKPDVI